MFGCKCFSDLQFDHQNTVHDEVHSEGQGNVQPAIGQPEANLALDPMTPQLEFMGQTGFVRTFQQPGSECSLNCDGRSDDGSGQIRVWPIDLKFLNGGISRVLRALSALSATSLIHGWNTPT